MTVYVDDMRAKFGRMIMCHMTADCLDELHDMADKIGIQRRWFQCPPKASRPHYDVSLKKRRLAISHGAVEIAWRDSLIFANNLLIEWTWNNAPQDLEKAVNSAMRINSLVAKSRGPWPKDTYQALKLCETQNTLATALKQEPGGAA